MPEFKIVKSLSQGLMEKISANYIDLPSLTLSQLNALNSSDIEVGALLFCEQIGIVEWNGLYYEVLDAFTDNLIGTTSGNLVPHQVTSNATGGSLTTEIPENQAWWNGTTNYARLGQTSVRINTVANSRQAWAINPNFRLYPSVKLLYGNILSFVGGQVDFLTDPVFQGWGALNNFATANPANGFYFRPPLVSETSFLKYVIRVASAESVFSTTISYDSSNRKFIKGDIIWDGTNLHFWATDTVNKSLNTISNFLTTYPTLGTLNLGFGVLNARNGTATTPIARNINVDITSYKIW